MCVISVEILQDLLRRELVSGFMIVEEWLIEFQWLLSTHQKKKLKRK